MKNFNTNDDVFKNMKEIFDALEKMGSIQIPNGKKSMQPIRSEVVFSEEDDKNPRICAQCKWCETRTGKYFDDDPCYCMRIISSQKKLNIVTGEIRDDNLYVNTPCSSERAKNTISPAPSIGGAKQIRASPCGPQAIFFELKDSLKTKPAIFKKTLGFFSKFFATIFVPPRKM